jgi:hypothetical protein
MAKRGKTDYRQPVLTLEAAMRLALHNDQGELLILIHPAGGYLVKPAYRFGESSPTWRQRFCDSIELRRALDVCNGDTFQAGQELLVDYERRQREQEGTEAVNEQP